MFGGLNAYRHLPRDIYIIAIATTISAAGSFVFPFLTLTLTQKLGLPPAQAGLAVFCTMFGFYPGSLIGGKLADSFGRKKIIAIAFAIAAALMGLSGFFVTSIYILPLLFAVQFFSGLGEPAMDALITDLATQENRKIVFSLRYLGFNLGFAFGPLFAGMLFLDHGHWLFWGDAITSLIAFLLILLYVQEPKLPEDMSQEPVLEQPSTLSLYRVLLSRPQLIIFTLLCTILTFIYGQVSFALPMQLVEQFQDKGPGYYGVIMALNAGAVLIMTPFIAALSVRQAPLVGVGLSGIFYAIGFGMIAFITGFYWFLISTLIWTIGEVLIASNWRTYIANHSPRSHRGRISGVLPSFSRIGRALAPLFGGVIAGQYDTNSVWIFIGILSCLTTALFFLLVIFEKRLIIAGSKRAV